MRTTVYVFKAPAPGPGDDHLSIPVGCVLREQDCEQPFFLTQPEALVWRDILGEHADPAQWAAVEARLPGYAVEEHGVEDDLETALRAWQIYVALAWETRGAMPLPGRGR
jgi:hypothetical protein